MVVCCEVVLLHSPSSDWSQMHKGTRHKGTPSGPKSSVRFLLVHSVFRNLGPTPSAPVKSCKINRIYIIIRIYISMRPLMTLYVREFLVQRKWMYLQILYFSYVNRYHYVNSTFDWLFRKWKLTFISLCVQIIDLYYSIGLCIWQLISGIDINGIAKLLSLW